MGTNASIAPDYFLIVVTFAALGLLIFALGVVFWLVRRGITASPYTPRWPSVPGWPSIPGSPVFPASPAMPLDLRCRYHLISSLVTPAEKKFLNCLDSVSPKEVRVFAKVRIADILSVGASINRSAWQTGFNKIAGKHVDFLMCRASDFAPLLVIELDDSTHLQEARRDRDDFLNSIFAEAKLPILRVQVEQSYNSQEMAKRLNAVFHPDGMPG